MENKLLRLLLALSLFFLNLFACNGDADSCRQKVVDSTAITKQRVQIPIQNNKLLIYSKTPPKEKILKQDPFLSLYIIEDAKKFAFPFKINNTLSLEIMAVDNTKSVDGKISKRQVGFESFATFTQPLSTYGLILNSCCDLEGIFTERGIIEKEYIERFMNIKNVSYGDFGIKVKDENSAVVVKESNSFIKSNQLKVGDIILELDSKKVKDSASFMRDMLFSQIGSTHNIKIMRDNKTLTLKASTQKKVIGDNLNNSDNLDNAYLKFLGLSFDKKLFITNIEKKAEHFELKVGDRLIQANIKYIKGADDFFDKSNNLKSPLNLLFEREHFQFFVKVN